jgi:hypothetical protein
MGMQDLQTRVARLEQTISAFAAELQLAFRYVRPDAASSLTKSRVVLEKLLLQVYSLEMGREPRKPLLGDMLADNQFTKKVERRIVSRMNAIRDMGNLGPHGEAVEPNDAARVLDDLCEVLEWYLRRYTENVQTALRADAADGAEECRSSASDDSDLRRASPENHNTVLVPSFQVTILDGPDKGLRFLLSNSRIVAGRAPHCDIVLRDNYVSRAVFSLNWDAERQTFVVIDFGCANPVLVNGMRVSTPHALSSGDLLAVGRTMMRFHGLSDGEEEQQPPQNQPP